MRHVKSATSASSLDPSRSAEQRTAAVVAALVAALLGMFIIYGAALAGPQALHNAAHDGRHAFAFPCH
jgi:cobalt transporter subunit CbtB